MNRSSITAKLFSLSVCLFVLYLNGCKNSNNEPTPVANPLLGTWTFSGILVRLGSEFTSTGDYFPFLTGQKSCLKNVTLQFKADNTVLIDIPADCLDRKSDIESYFNMKTGSTWSINNTNLLITSSNQQSTIPYVISGSTLTLETQGVDINADTKLDKLSLIFTKK